MICCMHIYALKYWVSFMLLKRLNPLKETSKPSNQGIQE
jgi:hypothetical protein